MARKPNSIQGNKMPMRYYCKKCHSTILKYGVCKKCGHSNKPKGR